MDAGQPRARVNEYQQPDTQLGKANVNKEAEAKRSLSRAASIIQAIALLALLPAWVDVIELNLSPVYGSIPAAKWRRILAECVCFAGVGLTVGRFPRFAKSVRSNLKLIPLMAFGSTLILHAYLYTASSLLGPMWGPIVTKAVIQIPLIFSSSVALTGLLKIGHSSMSWAVMVGIPWLFSPGLSLDLLSRYVGQLGSNAFLTRSGLLVSLALLFTVACSPAQSFNILVRRFCLAALVICYFLVYSQHGPTDLSLDTANRYLNDSQHIILERQESITGYISVLEDKRQNIRFMRCDHSLLGGNWLVNEVSIQHGMVHPETIFSVFVMLEAVRLMVPASIMAPSTSNPESALIM
jgi:hypothetical protein